MDVGGDCGSADRRDDDLVWGVGGKTETREDLIERTRDEKGWVQWKNGEEKTEYESRRRGKHS